MALYNKDLTGGSPGKGGSSGGSGPEDLVERLRTKLASRGARGIIGLGKQFRIMDDNNSRSLDLYEFTKAMKDYMLGFSDNEIKTLYNYFDSDRSGSVDYDEFLRSLRGPMNANRKKLVAQAYNKLDKDRSGYIDINDIKGVYSAKTHPDVLSGKKTEEQILLEFLETFETHHNLRNNDAPDHVVTKEEFEEYYNNISASIDNDQYFELMMNNAWKINEGDRSYGKGWANKDESPQKSAGQAYGARNQGPAAGTAAGQRAGTTGSQQNYSRPQTGSRPGPSNTGYSTGNNIFGTSAKPQAAQQQQTASSGPAMSYSEQQLLELFRSKLAARGARGLIGLAK
jgi:Ca2+-binding EF-hand superfamily protein